MQSVAAVVDTSDIASSIADVASDPAITNSINNGFDTNIPADATSAAEDGQITDSAAETLGIDKSMLTELSDEIKKFLDSDGDDFKYFGKLRLKKFDSKDDLDNYIGEY